MIMISIIIETWTWKLAAYMFLNNQYPPKSSWNFENSLCYTGLGRASLVVPANERVIMQISPSNKGIYQMCSCHIHIYIYTHTYIYIYIYREREIDR